MLRSRTILIALILLPLMSSAVQALPFTGRLVLRLDNAFLSLPPISLAGSGSGDPSLPSISTDAFLGSASVAVSGSPPLTQLFVSVTGNGPGSVGSGPSFAGTLQARGFDIGVPVIQLPLPGLGSPGATYFPPHTGGTGSLSAVFGGWTPGVTSVIRTHTLGTAACVASANSTVCPTGMLGGATANALFFGGSAQIVLVAPIDLYTTTGGLGGIPSFAIMALNYVPEPGALLLLVSGAAVLVLLGQRRRG